MKSCDQFPFCNGINMVAYHKEKTLLGEILHDQMIYTIFFNATEMKILETNYEIRK